MKRYSYGQVMVTMDSMTHGGPRIGGVSLDAGRSRIAGPGGSVHVEPRIIEVAVMLARHAGEVVSRDALIETHGSFRGFKPEDMATQVPGAVFHPGAIRFYREAGIWSE